ncbi:putative peptidylprolyl isomerase CWC27 LALA0_S04e03752g [Lachancea lanzarotensis]|uniref:LALA0S04e03752g1_1 n=1 Tax=Lachancea lanzarotensis TaxID=1245769 RepID=A0A0C7MPV8_9SACH|nr:uncharacterized protein LALA0_S04e03752g [Lachancea lanzarotensis]CEP61924.1 LALA0S04e03752g1_1 [Lachancea lanzarotensis]
MAGNLEPQTSARCTIWTSLGPLKVEIWAKQCPQTALKFLKNCVNDRYNGASFHRKVYDAAVQTSEIDSEPWGILENDPGIKMNRRGLLAIDIESKGDFFITLRETPELDGQVTVLGQLVDNTFYTLLEISQKELDSESNDDRYLYPAVVERIEVEEQFFEQDLKSSPTKKKSRENPVSSHRPPPKRARVRLDYDHDEDVDDEVSQAVNFKMTSAHDLLAPKGLMRSAKQQQQDVKKDVEEPVAKLEDDSAKKHHKNKFIGQNVEPPNANDDDQDTGKVSAPVSDSETREWETMRLLAQFKQKLAKSNVLNSHELNFDEDDHGKKS